MTSGNSLVKGADVLNGLSAGPDPRSASSGPTRGRLPKSAGSRFGRLRTPGACLSRPSGRGLHRRRPDGIARLWGATPTKQANNEKVRALRNRRVGDDV